MSKEIVDMFEYILDIVDPQWRTIEAVKETMDKIRSEKSKKFVPPTLEEVVQELRSQKVRFYQQNAEKFWNFYESKNWMVGKNKMKSWKAAIKTWNFEKERNIII